MITAKEAYDKAEKKRNETREKEMQDIEDSITAASSNGFFGCLIDYVISKNAIERLKSYGYEVTTIPQRGFGCGEEKTQISWEALI